MDFLEVSRLVGDSFMNALMNAPDLKTPVEFTISSRTRKGHGGSVNDIFKEHKEPIRHCRDGKEYPHYILSIACIPRKAYYFEDSLAEQYEGSQRYRDLKYFDVYLTNVRLSKQILKDFVDTRRIVLAWQERALITSMGDGGRMRSEDEDAYRNEFDP